MYRIVRNKANDRSRSQDSPTAGQQPPELQTDDYSPGSAQQQKCFIPHQPYAGGVTIVTSLPPTEHLVRHTDAVQPDTLHEPASNKHKLAPPDSVTGLPAEQLVCTDCTRTWSIVVTIAYNKCCYICHLLQMHSITCVKGPCAYNNGQN